MFGRLYGHTNCPNTALAPRVLAKWPTTLRSTAEKLKEFRAATETRPRPVGSPGHLASRRFA